MKKTFSIVLIVLIISMYFTGCTDDNKVINDIPKMYVEYSTNGNTSKVTVLHGTASWKYKNWNGTFTAVETDSLHPLDSLKEMPVIEKTNEVQNLKLSFSKIPDSYTVRRWTDNYAGNNQACENYYETVEVSNDTINLPNDNQGYIYEVHAIWPQGNVYYAFQVR